MKKLLFLIAITLFSPLAQGQFDVRDPFASEDSDLNIGGDIFSDFNEDIDAKHVMEDERFFRYGRFFSFQTSIGMTSFTGNRGDAYINDHPSYGLGVNFFMDFQSSYGLGFEFSKHHFYLNDEVHAYRKFTDGGAGLVDVSMLRVYFSYRYYIETANLGTALTYSNPYFIMRMEYWYVTNKFKDQDDIPNDAGGGLGFAVGGGLEFPIKIKESYLGVELLWHEVNYDDKNTENYRPVEGKEFGYDDFTGSTLSIMISYVISW